MIYSSRNILEIRSRLQAITPEQWLFLALGLVTGACIWLLVNRRIIHRVVAGLRNRPMKNNAIALIEGCLGAIVFVTNAFLVYVSTLIASFFFSPSPLSV
jgi:hypothetical protein